MLVCIHLQRTHRSEVLGVRAQSVACHRDGKINCGRDPCCVFLPGSSSEHKPHAGNLAVSVLFPGIKEAGKGALTTTPSPFSSKIPLKPVGPGKSRISSADQATPLSGSVVFYLELRVCGLCHSVLSKESQELLLT